MIIYQIHPNSHIHLFLCITSTTPKPSCTDQYRENPEFLGARTGQFEVAARLPFLQQMSISNCKPNASTRSRIHVAKRNWGHSNKHPVCPTGGIFKALCSEVAALAALQKKVVHKVVSTKKLYVQVHGQLIHVRHACPHFWPANCQKGASSNCFMQAEIRFFKSVLTHT